MRRSSLIAIAAAVAFTCGTVAVYAQELSDSIRSGTEQRYGDIAAQIAQLRAATDLASKLDLAKLLAAGLPTAPGNPISKPDTAGALDLIATIAAGNDANLRQQALGLKATILLRSRVVTEIEEGKALDLQLAAEGYAPSLARVVNAGLGLPQGLSLDAAVSSLNAPVLAGDSSATFALAKLLAEADPARSKVLASQALLYLTAEANKNVTAATELGRRYLYGDGVPANPTRALQIFGVAIKSGANGPLTVLNDAVVAKLPGLDAAGVKALIVSALAAGSSKAAELIASDGMDGSAVYGFTPNDARYAISLMADIGDRSALLMGVKAYVRGLGAAPDIDKAVPYIEKLTQVDGLEPAAILDLGDDLERLNLPMPLALKYIEPLYRKVTGPDRDEAVYRADRLLAAAVQAGTITPGSLGSARITSIIAELKDNATRNHARSLILLGDLYYSGIWVPINNRQAMQYYDRSLSIEPSEVAKERLGKVLMLVKSSPFEDQRYRKLVSDLAATGNQWGQYRKGLLLIEDATSTPDDVKAGEAILLDLASKAYPPAVRALIKHLNGVKDDARIDEAVNAFSSAWGISKDIRIGRLLGEFYQLAGRTDQARAVLEDPIFAQDLPATLDLARLEAAMIPRDDALVLSIAKRGIALAKDDQPSQLDFVTIIQQLDLPDAQAEGQNQLNHLADIGNTDAISKLMPAYLDRIETDPAAFETVLKWSTILAASGAETPILDLASRYLVRGANPAIAAKVLDISFEALKVLPPDSYLAVLVADALYAGYGVPTDIDRGNALIESAASAGNKDALAELGMQFFYGMGRRRDPDTALVVLDSAAALGSNVARVEVGRLYSSSTGPYVDMLKAYSMFLAAADDGSTAGMLEVGRLYLAGWGIAKDEGKGVDWLEKAASLGNTDAMYQLYFHYLAKDDPASQETAMMWLRKSSDSGVDPARLRLAERLLADNREANYDEVITLLDDAYTNGYNLAGKFKRSMGKTASASVPAAAPEPVSEMPLPTPESGL